MKRINLLSIAILAAATLLVGAASAQAQVTLGPGSYPFYTLAANSNDGGVDDNVYEVTGTLTLQTGAKIHCNDNAVDQPPPPFSNNGSACDITIRVTAGDLVMETGSAIQAENLISGGNGGNVTIIVDGNVLLEGNDALHPGALISSRKISGAGDTGIGGNITIHAGDTTCGPLQDKGDVTVELGAQILADSPGNPGDIEILSGRFITIDGRVSSNNGTSHGRAGRITLIACCDLRIGVTGIVSSRGHDPGADLVHLEACTVEILGLVESTGAGHNDAGAIGASACIDANHPPPAGRVFRGCVEVWSGSTVLIDASGLNNGQVNADMAFGGGQQGMGWIDVYANGDITITGNTVAPFAVHANTGVTNAHGGAIAIKSKGGNVAASGLAVQADSTNGGSTGGDVLVEALAINLGNASVFARGDFAETGGYGKGGTETIRAFTGPLTWIVGGVGDVRPTGVDNVGVVLPPANRGIILLFGCPVPTPTASFPFNGTASTMPAPAICPGGSPTIPEPANTALVARLDCTANNCTREIPPPPFFCEKAPVRDVLDPVNGRFPLNQGPDKVVRVDLGASIQAELDLAAIPGYDASHNNDGYIIIAVSAHADGSLGGHTTQSADINGNYEWPFAIFGCSVTMHDPTPLDGNATGHIAVGATAPPPPGVLEGIFIMDLHGADSSGKAGWFVEGNSRYVRNTYGSNSGTGVWIKGDHNVMHNGNAIGNSGVGLKIEGNFNFAGDTDVFSNGSYGAQVIGNNNEISKVDAGDKGKGNNGDGLNLSGNNNLIEEVDAYANKGWGFVVNGTLNTLDSNTAGDRGDKANGKGGFLLSGTGSLLQNTAIGNLGGPALGDGFKFTTSGFSLLKNISGGSGSGTPNTGCQFNFGVAGNLDAGGNKSKNVAIAGTGSPKKFAAGCK